MNQKINWTTQRRVIYELVRDTTDHPTASDVMEQLRAEGHQFAYGTVYNSLRYLVDMGLVRELKLGNAVSRYDARTEDHLHVICDVCGKVAEAEIDLPTRWLEEIAATTSFQLDSPEILLHGVCPDCRRAN
ncbi:transcriptional repressor [Alicyclobacillus fastidiosus]|uniref:Transcriptional repressor n=1 Tax=Alicyclobacillus fastidiosus TaxID=392011 RepID=A0ABY6ZDS6_9BACL|nr:transcriptional repressor [Alicyclobacillus fastidiosus]WAH40992.1 transcriptional repressor [Alicyclobacillus fastidiosus]GMA62507.1 transcriptional repressor [Alicyclobacillus fastidiosus]